MPLIYLSIPSASTSLSLSTVSTILLACAYNYNNADLRPAPLFPLWAPAEQDQHPLSHYKDTTSNYDYEQLSTT